MCEVVVDSNSKREVGLFNMLPTPLSILSETGLDISPGRVFQ